MRKTEKIYYDHPYVQKIQARIVKFDENKNQIELDRTIAYPEGGGQESDQGTITHLKSAQSFPFQHVKRMYGQDVKVEDNHHVNVDGIILHFTPKGTSFENLTEGDEVIIEIDPLLREKHSTSHSAAHLLYLGIQQVRPDVIKGTIGCHIKEGQARFDFRVENRLGEEDIQQIEEIANQFVAANHPIKTYSADVHPDARYWECDGHAMPCGGTHLETTQSIGPLKVRRKNIGKGKERVICTLEKPTYSCDQYKDL